MSSSPPKRIGLVTWDDRDAKGGLGRAMVWLQQELTSLGHTAVLFSPSEGYLSWTKSFGGHIAFSLFCPFLLPRFIKAHALDMVIVPVGPGGVFLLHSLGVPVIASVHHLYTQQWRAVPGQWWKVVCTLCEYRTLKRCARILSYCTDTQEALKKHYGLSSLAITQYFAVEDWVPKGSLSTVSGLCLCTARLDARKGVFVLLRAWKEVLKHVPHARLIVVGKGSDEHRVDAWVAQGDLQIERRCDLSREELITLTQQAEIAICPSYLEGFGLAAAEAMAAQTSVIASDVDGLRNLIEHEVTGVLVPPGNADRLAEEIVALLTDEGKRHRLAEKGSRVIQAQFHSSKAAASLQTALSPL